MDYRQYLELMASRLPFKPPPPGAIAPETTVHVGRYTVKVERFLNEGGFAHVYLTSSAVPIPEGSPYAVTRHVLKRVAVPDRAGVDEVIREVQVMKKLRNQPKIVNLIEATCSQISTGYEIFILMEWCAGGGIIDMLNTRLSNRLTELEVLKIFSDTVEAVAFMHYQEPAMVHRDLKIENVLMCPVSPNYSLYKLCDFGSTSEPVRDAKDIPALEHEINTTTTLQYRAPELVDVWRTRGFDEKIDIWALGVLLYKLCYYTTPFEQGGTLAILSGKYAFPTFPVYSSNMRHLINTMLRVNPEERPNIYQVHEFVCKLRNIPLKFPNKYLKSNGYKRPTTYTQPSSAPVPAPTAPSKKPLSAQAIAAGISPMRRGRPSKADSNRTSAVVDPALLSSAVADISGAKLASNGGIAGGKGNDVLPTTNGSSHLAFDESFDTHTLKSEISRLSEQQRVLEKKDLSTVEAFTREFPDISDLSIQPAELDSDSDAEPVSTVASRMAQLKAKFENGESGVSLIDDGEDMSQISSPIKLDHPIRLENTGPLDASPSADGPSEPALLAASQPGSTLDLLTPHTNLSTGVSEADSIPSIKPIPTDNTAASSAANVSSRGPPRLSPDPTQGGGASVSAGNALPLGGAFSRSTTTSKEFASAKGALSPDPTPASAKGSLSPHPTPASSSALNVPAKFGYTMNSDTSVKSASSAISAASSAKAVSSAYSPLTVNTAVSTPPSNVGAQSGSGKSGADTPDALRLSREKFKPVKPTKPQLPSPSLSRAVSDESDASERFPSIETFSGTFEPRRVPPQKSLSQSSDKPVKPAKPAFIRHVNHQSLSHTETEKSLHKKEAMQQALEKGKGPKFKFNTASTGSPASKIVDRERTLFKPTPPSSPMTKNTTSSTSQTETSPSVSSMKNLWEGKKESEPQFSAPGKPVARKEWAVI